ncbi:MAG TPA: prepilin-type N-terminal cleavage/methylation domain-containing protein [Candidatus Paceibacterota bacterium]|nr:prepilin-type N-terminal cleavage/methylation domain-containing protein [Candidatus Paceibacterota bacterium]HRZ34586.1 prepilin-type N-terminal cleavage/methylation domain-containing protein [Candidatus Paceibacterota bacterium]
MSFFQLSKRNTQKGFTLLEMLLVIAIIAILAAIVIVAINPSRQLAQARNAQRASDLNAIHKAVQQYYIDELDWPDGLDGSLQEICDTGGDTVEPDCVDLSAELVPTYLSALPENPNGGNYEIALQTGNKLALIAPGSKEQGLGGVVIGTSTSLVEEEGGGEDACADYATGGTVTEDGSYCVHTFTSDDTFTALTTLTADILVVGGGGGGGRHAAGGGGGGGVIELDGESLDAGDYSVTIGDGGAGAIVEDARGNAGSASLFDTTSAAGGGYGGGYGDSDGGNGGSGGGGAHSSGSGGLGNTPEVAPAQGNDGGSGNSAPGIGSGGGGGGAGEIGDSALYDAGGGDGGDGISSSITGVATYYGGGGGGGTDSNTVEYGDGGLGGGGQGGQYDGAEVSNGESNTGGGGGGGGYTQNGGNGGSGIVVVRYSI